MPTDRLGEAIAYRPSEAASLLGVSRAHVYRLLASGQLRARKAGKATLIPAAELRRYLDSLPEWEPEQ